MGLAPDLPWWDGATRTFVGDAKYKNLTNARVPNADLYPLLAYAIALDLPVGSSSTREVRPMRRRIACGTQEG